MNKITLEFTAEGQSLTNVTEGAKFASNTVDYVEASFDLGDGWSDFDAVRAIWFTDLVSVAAVLDFDGCCMVPHEVLTRKRKVRVNLVGSIAEGDVLTDRLTTYPVVALTVDANAHVDDEAQPITPSQFDQYVEAVRDAVAEIKDVDSVTLNADYTLTFNYSDGSVETVGPIRGAAGPQGPTGPQGPQGPQGESVDFTVTSENLIITEV